MKRMVIVGAFPIAISLAVFIGRTHRLPLVGDEPHYLMIADSVISDGDLDLHNNYLRDFQTRRIFGLVIPHVYNVRRGWMPYHTPGLGILLAIPFGIAGTIGARVTLMLFTATLLSWSLMTWLADRLRTALAVWVTLGLTLTLPIVFDAAQIYPDLPAGVIITALAVWLIRRIDSRQGGLTWMGYWLSVGALPWLHIKYVGTVVVFAMGGLFVASRCSSRRVPLWTSLLVIVGIGSLGLFRVWAFGTPLGARGARELTTSASRATMIFLGCISTRARGCSSRIPYCLLAWQRLRCSSTRVRVLHCSGWSCTHRRLCQIRWSSPDSVVEARSVDSGGQRRGSGASRSESGLASQSNTRDRHVRLAVAASVMYQAALAMRWLQNPDVLFPELDEPRDSLFPDLLRPWLPSFYFWDFSSYWSFTPNIVALIGIGVIVVAGAFALRPPLGKPLPIDTSS